MADKKVMTIDMTPSWEGLVPVLAELYVNGDSTARQELTKMGKVADMAKEYQEKLIAIEQLVGGEEGKELLRFKESGAWPESGLASKISYIINF